MDFLKKYWPSILAAGGGVITFLLPSISAAAASNPKTALGVLCGCIIAAHNMTAPKDAK